MRSEQPTGSTSPVGLSHMSYPEVQRLRPRGREGLNHVQVVSLTGGRRDAIRAISGPAVDIEYCRRIASGTVAIGEVSIALCLVKKVSFLVRLQAG